MTKTITLLAILLLLSGCSTFFKAQNSKAQPGMTRYDSQSFNKTHNFGDNIVILAFSGGGTRAAALSYGVMQELESTVLERNGVRTTLLDDVDFISGVSGGSFTAAYYGAFGKDIFDNYEKKFLRQSNESVLLSKMFSPSYWVKTLTSVFDRTELAIEYYDQHIFERKTFGDIPFENRPYIVINATDLSLGQRFSFEQDTFDLICSDLSSYPIARAVTASSAVPILFPSVVLENYRDSCSTSFSGTQLEKTQSLDDTTQTKKDFLHKLKAYMDSRKKRYVHLVDGGLSDNLGLRAISDRLEVFGLGENRNEGTPIKRIFIVLVNSSVEPEREMDTSPDSASLSETLDAFTEALISNRSSDTKSYFFDEDNEFEKLIKMNDPNIEIFTTEVAFSALESEEQQRFFNKLPTSLELPNEHIDQVIEAGKTLLRQDPEFNQFLNSIRQSN